jgi:hypothetical protein
VVGDSGVPLITWAQLTEGAFADLARGYTSTQVQNDILIEATRACEGMADNRRLAPFTISGESHRAEGIDPDEYSDSTNLPMDIRSTIGASYAMALGASSLVRACWLSEYAPKYTDMWTYSNVSVSVVRSYGGSQDISPSQILSGPDPDTGRLWFQLGVFVPVASQIYVTYSGGYTTVPADLSRACKYAAAAIMLDELDPMHGGSEHDPDVLRALAEDILLTYGRS